MVVLNTPINWEVWGRTSGSDLLLINTICLPLPEDESVPGYFDNPYKNATIFSWGKIWEHTYPHILQRGDVEVKYDEPRARNFFQFKALTNETRGCVVSCIAYDLLH